MTVAKSGKATAIVPSFWFLVSSFRPTKNLKLETRHWQICRDAAFCFTLGRLDIEPNFRSRRRGTRLRRSGLRPAFVLHQLQIYGAENDLAAQLYRQAPFIRRDPNRCLV